MVVKHIKTRDEYKAALEESNQKLVVIDFFAEWCGPCKVIAPQVAKFSDNEFADKAEFYKVDVEELQDVAAENNVRAMPTFLLFKDGKRLEDGQVVGANPAALKAAINKHC